jgi:hypothetical protein
MYVDLAYSIIILIGLTWVPSFPRGQGATLARSTAPWPVIFS